MLPQPYRGRHSSVDLDLQEAKKQKEVFEKTTVELSKMSSFHFTKAPPDEQMYTDIKSLNKFEEKPFCQLVDIVFSFLVSPKEGTRFMSQVAEFAGEHGVGTNALKNVVKSLLSFFKSALKSNLTPAQVKEDLEHLGKNIEWKVWLVPLLGTEDGGGGGTNWGGGWGKLVGDWGHIKVTPEKYQKYTLWAMIKLTLIFKSYQLLKLNMLVF